MKDFLSDEQWEFIFYKDIQVHSILDTEGNWNFTNLPPDICSILLDILSDSGLTIIDSEDRLVWTPTTDGCFSTKSAWTDVVLLHLEQQSGSGASASAFADLNPGLPSFEKEAAFL